MLISFGSSESLGSVHLFTTFVTSMMRRSGVDRARDRHSHSQSETFNKCHRPMRSKSVWESSLTGALPSQGAAGESCHRESDLMSHQPIRGSYCPPTTNERQGNADVTQLMTVSPSHFITDVTTNQQPLSSAIVNGEFGKFVHHQCSPDLSDCIFILHNISHWTRETDAIIVIPHIAQSHPDSIPTPNHSLEV